MLEDGFQDSRLQAIKGVDAILTKRIFHRTSLVADVGFGGIVKQGRLGFRRRHEQ